MRRLEGILGPVVSTFDGDGELAPAAFKRNVRAHLDAGLAGVVVAGSSGEAPLLSERERDRLVELAREEVPAGGWVIAGVGAESTAATVERARRAADRGADAVLVVPPHYYLGGMSLDALATHYRRVADASPRPVLLYNVPKFTHLPLEPALVRLLAEHENVTGMKDSSGDLDRLREYLGAQGDRFTVLTGHGGTLADALAMGARGAVLAVSLFAPALALAVYAGARAGSREAAREAQARLAPLAGELAGALGPAGIKAALDAVGLAGGPVRPPLLALEAGARARVTELLRAADVARAA